MNKIEFIGDLLEWKNEIRTYEDGSMYEVHVSYFTPWIIYEVCADILDTCFISRLMGHETNIILTGFLNMCTKDEAKKACETHAREQLLNILTEAPIRIKPDEPVTGKDCKWRAAPISTWIGFLRKCKNKDCPIYDCDCPDDFGCTCAERQEEEDEN